MEPVAIIGIGCRLPGAVQTPEQFWQLLRDGVDAIADAPQEREALYRAYDPAASPATPGRIVTPRGGFLQDIDGFDAEFFGITPREAVRMDPQQRQLLEVAWESLEDAGWVPSALPSKQVGVFIGMWTNDYQDILYRGLDDIDLYATTGSGHYAASGRLSYLLDLRGPSMTIDTACSSSLVALHLACQSLRQGECSLALVGGTNLILQPHLSIGYSRSKMLSPDGCCKFGDQQANGYVRSEGVAVIVLKLLATARADRDHMYALIRGSGVNNDGRSGASLVKPGFESQKQLICAVYQQSGIAASDVDYIEAHGTGTGLGDEIELRAIGAALTSAGRALDNPCYVGSMKTNIGHTESTSGVAGVIKLALSLRHRQIPASLHFKTPHARIPWSQLPLVIPGTLTPWPDKDKVAYASINSYGVTGTNAHALLQEAPLPARPGMRGERPSHLLTLSARSAPALRQLASAYLRYLQEHHEHLNLGDVCFTTHVGRAHFAYRLGLVAESMTEMEQQLAAFLNEETTEEEAPAMPGKTEREMRAGVAFLLPARSSTYAGMAHQLYANEPTFRREFDRCMAITGYYLDCSIQPHSLFSPEEVSLTDKPIWQAALFALQYALVSMWQSWGITPEAVCGEGMGVYVAACLASVLPLEEALRLCIEHAWLRQARRMTGEPALASQEQNFAQTIEVLSAAVPHTAALSTRVARVIEHADMTNCWISYVQETHHDQQAYESLEACMHALREQGCTLCIEMGAGPDGDHLECEVPRLYTLSVDLPAWRQVHLALGTCYMQHVFIDWQAFETAFPYQRLSLPTYAFQHTRYHLPRVASASPPALPAELLNRLQFALPAQRSRLIQEYVHRLVAAVLGYGPETPLDPLCGFWNLGMTSLMTVELHEQIQIATGRSLLPTLLFDYPSIEGVSNYLAREFALPDLGGAFPAVSAPVEQSITAKNDGRQEERRQEIQQLSDEAAVALLQDELAALEEDIQHF
ncbi:MAG TPA: beta-ketoacyl synthase N-terminal-like domain-containing protein [Ktedonobacteraceae bacterium]